MPAGRVATAAVRSYRRIGDTPTCPAGLSPGQYTFSPLPDPFRRSRGRIKRPRPYGRSLRPSAVPLSDPLSIASRRPAINRHPALRSPDFPPRSILRTNAATAWPTSGINSTRFHKIRPNILPCIATQPLDRDKRLRRRRNDRLCLQRLFMRQHVHIKA